MKKKEKNDCVKENVRMCQHEKIEKEIENEEWIEWERDRLTEILLILRDWKRDTEIERHWGEKTKRERVKYIYGERQPERETSYGDSDR